MRKVVGNRIPCQTPSYDFESKLIFNRIIQVPTIIPDVSTILQNLTITESVPATLFLTETRVENVVLLSTTTQLLRFTSTSTVFVKAGQVVTSTTTNLLPTTYTIHQPAAFNVTGQLLDIYPQ